MSIFTRASCSPATSSSTTWATGSASTTSLSTRSCAAWASRTGIDLPGEAEGIVPSSRWKIRNTREKWYAGETISVSIGQGALTVTPLQLAYAIGGLAMGGVWYTPHIVAEPARQEKPRRANLNLENVAKVIYGMYGVVNEGGTGARGTHPGRRAVRKDRHGPTRLQRGPERHQPGAVDEGQRLVRGLCAASVPGDRGGGAGGGRAARRYGRGACRQGHRQDLFRQEVEERSRSSCSRAIWRAAAGEGRDR